PEAAGERPMLSPNGLGAACAAALFVVLAVTRCGYVYPSGSTFSELLQSRVNEATIREVKDDEKVCLSREPFTFLYAATFRPPRRYEVKEVETREDCGDYRFIE